ncbi:MAG: glycosyltransferase [Patescibacteria group bacterium]
MRNFKSEYKDYSKHVAVMISTDRSIFLEKSPAWARMLEHSKLYKELHIIVFSLKRFQKQQLSEKCFLYSTDSFSKLGYVTGAFRVGKKILKKIDKQAPVLISCQDPFETGLAGKCLTHWRKDSELLLQIHTDLFSPYFTDNRIGLKNAVLNRIRVMLSKRTLPQADVVRVVSQKIAESLVEKGINAEKILIKPIDVNLTAFQQNAPAFNLHEKYPQFKKILLMVSRLETEKNIPMALEAVKIAQAQIPGLGVVIVGSGSWLPQLKKLAYSLKIEASVAFVGWQTDLVPYYKGCDVFLLTSWFEGYGMVLKEAQTAGCRIISTDVGIVRDVGAHIAEHTAQSISEKIVEALK